MAKTDTTETLQNAVITLTLERKTLEEIVEVKKALDTLLKDVSDKRMDIHIYATTPLFPGTM